MQNLVALTHKRGAISLYKEQFAKLKKKLIELDSLIIGASQGNEGSNKVDNIDSRIISMLDKLVPSASLSYKQAVADLSEKERYSWRGPATDLREALRETLDYLAPDSEVTQGPNYKQEPDTHGPTMKQKVRFVLQNRGLSKKLSGPAENATKSIEDTIGTFVRSVYSRSNISTHTPTDKKEVLRIRDWIKIVLCELLEIHE